MAKIKDIKARQILDSRGNPTVECDVILDDGSLGRASVPSGASTGIYEAVELRDGDPAMYHGKSVLRAIHNIHHEIKPALIGLDAAHQEIIDHHMLKIDGTPNKSHLGANSILAVSMAVASAQANSEGKELFEYLSKFSPKHNEEFVLPFPMMNVMNGGRHAVGASDFQEYMIIPGQTTTFRDRLRCGAEIFHMLKQILEKHGYQTTVGDEGGFAPALGSNTKPLDFIIQAIEEAGYKPGIDVFLAIDVASSEFFNEKEYVLATENKRLTSIELIHYYDKLFNQYPIRSIEDPLEQNDFEGWSKFTKEYGSRIQIVGDDLYVTNVKRLKKGINMQSSNSILIKLNQIGTLTETIDAINLAHQNGFTTIVSHRSGETEDTFIADLVVAMRTGQIKTGSLSRTERIAKYNRLLRIEEIIFSR
ncbi:MAG: enolase [Candidatus Dojkabacteria bacterium]|nr:MAG: enolase [Candidatus Dojkabacteria bacterium]